MRAVGSTGRAPVVVRLSVWTAAHRRGDSRRTPVRRTAALRGVGRNRSDHTHVGGIDEHQPQCAEEIPATIGHLAVECKAFPLLAMEGWTHMRAVGRHWNDTVT
eukprot:gene12893-biopygen1820